MRLWGKRKKSPRAAGKSLSLEKLEDRSMMAALALVSGQVTSFVDADGTQVHVKLSGPGEGAIELVGGVITGAAIDTLSLTGTTGASKLKISTRGGSVKGTTINELAISKALNELGALKHLKAKKLYFNDGGSFNADGNVEKIHVRALGDNVNFDVDGNVAKFKTYSLGEDTSVDITGVLQKFVAQLLETGSEVSAEQLDMLKIKQQAMGTSIDVGDGGLARAKINYLYNSSIASQGDVGKFVVRGDVMNSALASNIDKGSDGVFGTIDDFVVDAAAAGYIGMVKFKGAIGAAGTSQEVSIVTSGSVGTMILGPQASVENEPFVWEQAASQFIPLSISQAALEATGFEDNEIWVAVFGEQIKIPKPGEIPPLAQAYYLDATQLNGTNPILTSTQNLVPSASTPNLPIIPSSTIAAWENSSTAWGSNLAFPVPPKDSQWTGRIVISAGAPVQAQVNQDQYHSVSAPSAGDPTDPSNGTFYDFLEFTVSNSKAGVVSLDMDTSQVDSFGMPLGLQFFQDAAGTQPFNLTINGTSNGNNQITGVTNLSALIQAGLGTGQPVTGPTGSGIQPGTLISSLDPSGNTIYLNQSVSSSTSVTLTAYAGGIVGVQANRDDILSGTTNDSLFQFLQNQIADGNAQAQAFLQSAAPFRTAGAMRISGASNSSPITITTYNVSQLADNDWVYISGVGGNTAANGYYQVTIPSQSTTTFTLNGSTGNGAYTSGGTWSMAITGTQPDGSNRIQVNASNTLGLQNGDLVEITGVTSETAANGTWTVAGVTATSFSLVGSTATGTYSQVAGSWNVYAPGNRLVSPKDIVEGLASPSDPSALNNYFNEVIDAFFVYYSDSSVPVGNSGTPGNNTFNLVSTAYKNTPLTYSGQVELDTTYGAYALTLSDATNTDPTTYKIYYPFFDSNLPSNYTPLLPIATTTPPWIISQGWSNQSASQMIFACDAVFADNVARATYDMTGTDAVSVLGDLEDSISAAFNRGIVLNSPDTWDQTSTWFQQNASQASTFGIEPGTYNYWVEYWHQTGLTYKDLAYAFPYDDKFGASTNLNVTNVGLAQVTLGHWTGSATKLPSTTTFQNFPTSAGPTSNLTLTAQVAGTNPTGTVAFFINGIPINSQDNSASPPVEFVAVSGGTATITAAMPTLPTGAATYTVTAVYSGDDDNLPSMTYASLPIVPQINVALTETSGVLGSNTQITSTTPGTVYDGTLTYTISKSDGSNSIPLAANVPTTMQTTENSYPVPTNVVTFTGNADGTNTISGIDNMTDLMTGQVIAGTGVPTGTTITGLGASSITLNNTVATGTGIQFTSNGAGATLPISVSFTPTGSMTPSASGSTNLTVTADPYSFILVPGSGTLGSTPTMTITLPGPPYNGTIDFQTSRPDGTDAQSLGTVNVDGSTLSGGNQVVVNNLAIPSDLLTLTAYADGTNVLQGISTVSGIVPTQQSISGGGTSGNQISGFAPPALTLTNAAAATSTDPVTFTVGGVTITGMTTMGQQAVQVTSVSGWTIGANLDGESITDNDNNNYVGAGNTVNTFTAGTMTLQNTVPSSGGSPVTFTSTANASAYPITAVWTPTTGGPLASAPQMFGVT